MINKWLKKIISIKTENIILLLYIPYMIINLSKANTDLFMVAIAMHLMLSVAIHYSIRETRQEIKDYIFNLEPIRLNIPNKKELLSKVFNKYQPQQLLNIRPFLNNSIN